MKIRTQLAAVAAVLMLVGLAACGGDDDAATPADTSTDTGSSGAGSSPEASHSGDHSDGSSVITMTDNTFSPADLTVAPGTAITVKNAGAARHDLQDKGSNGKAFDSGDINGGEEGSVTAPDEVGDYPYKCTYHFGMEGTLHVK